MEKARIYMDNCCFNRPYDNQIYQTIRLETEAKLFIQHCIKTRQIELIWSFILDFENAANPFEDRKKSIEEWKSLSTENVRTEEKIRDYAKKLETSHGIKPKDALHLACAIDAKSKYFLTTDKILFKKGRQLQEITVLNPVDFVILWEDK